MVLMTHLHVLGTSCAASTQNDDNLESPQGTDPDTLVQHIAEYTPKHVRRQRQQPTAVFFVVLMMMFVVFVAPSPYVVESPGPTQNVLGSVKDKPVIAIEGARSYEKQSEGQLLLTTVSTLGLHGSVSGIQTFVAWVDPHAAVLPKEVVIPPGKSLHEFESDSRNDMTSSQESAKDQALKFLHAQGVDTANISVSVHVDDIGGPSAGLMYALGIIDKLTPQDETGGQVIAGTGTMEADGNVGRIGGIRLKMLAAKRDGATWFLVPAGNCDEAVGHVPEGLRDVKVANLTEAYEALTNIGSNQGESLPRCSVG